MASAGGGGGNARTPGGGAMEEPGGTAGQDAVSTVTPQAAGRAYTLVTFTAEEALSWVTTWHKQSGLLVLRTAMAEQQSRLGVASVPVTYVRQGANVLAAVVQLLVVVCALDPDTSSSSSNVVDIISPQSKRHTAMSIDPSKFNPPTSSVTAHRDCKIPCFPHGDMSITSFDPR